jgi:hypothetical protein
MRTENPLFWARGRETEMSTIHTYTVRMMHAESNASCTVQYLYCTVYSNVNLNQSQLLMQNISPSLPYELKSNPSGYISLIGTCTFTVFGDRKDKLRNPIFYFPMMKKSDQ